YNEELHYVEPCLNGTLVQADITNKDHFREHLDKLFAKGIGMLDIALTEAFSLLNDFNQTGRGSVCSQAIMLITDGAVDTYDAVFAKYNWPDRKVRIFPYLIGRESAFADNLKWMACANKALPTVVAACSWDHLPCAGAAEQIVGPALRCAGCTSVWNVGGPRHGAAAE
ncbi:hypothetical protein JZ751_014533, partial [Albula glossodonta]